MDQVRTSGGATFARGCMNEDGRLSWPMMQARMGGGRVGVTLNRRPAASPVEATRPNAEDYATPPSLDAYPAARRLYRVLLAMADDDGVFPRVDVVCECADLGRNGRAEMLKLMALLGHQGLIVQRLTGVNRVLRIVATGQFLRSAGMAASEVV